MATMFNKSIIAICLCALFALEGCKQARRYSIAITNAKIWTGNKSQPWAESILISGDTIARVASNKEIENYLSDTDTVINAQGKLIVPGFIDAHLHTIMGGLRLSSVKLKEVNTKTDFIQAIKRYAKTLHQGEWILGGDWDHQHWGGELPTHEWIDSVTTENPLWLERSEGHSGLANKLALDLAKVTKATKDMEGGTIVRNRKGEPTGIFKDNSMSLIFKIIPDLSDAQKEKAITAAMNLFLSEGITSAHHMIEPHERNPSGKATDFAAFKKMRENGKLKVRFYVAEPYTDWASIDKRIKTEGKGDEWLKTGALKGYVDGAIGSHSALFFDDYTDRPGFRGDQINSQEELFYNIQKADSLGFKICIHAIGDKAIHIALQVFNDVEKRNGIKDRRFRIEHTQHIKANDISLMKKLNVIASMQPYHAIDDGSWCEQSIGPERIKTTYAAKSIMDSSVHVAFGSDWFVAPPSPIKGIYAAVTRRTLDGKNPNGWVPAQKITVEDALRNYTSEAAYASFDEKIKGTLEPGKLADLVMLDKNIFEVNPIALWDVKIDFTMVGGKIRYDRFKPKF